MMNGPMRVPAVRGICGIPVRGMCRPILPCRVSATLFRSERQTEGIEWRGKPPMHYIVARVAPLGLIGLLLVANPAAQAQNDRWVATWATAQTLVRAVAGAAAGRGAAPLPAAPSPPPATAPGPFPPRRFPVPAVLPSVNNQTVRMIVRSTVARTPGARAALECLFGRDRHDWRRVHRAEQRRCGDRRSVEPRPDIQRPGAPPRSTPVRSWSAIPSLCRFRR